MTESEATLHELARIARLPADEAESLPPVLYYGQDFFTLESAHIFERSWLCVGRSEEIPNVGDWFNIDILKQPILVVRSGDNRIRALANTCAHRFAQLKTGKGHSLSLQCPYHAWTYSLEGKLIGAPMMSEAVNFAMNAVCLESYRVEVWLGFIFVNFDRNAEPLATQLEPLAQILEPLDVENFATAVREEDIWNANWKIVIENAMESYHVFQVHSDTIQTFYPTASIKCFPGTASYNLHTVNSPGADADLHWRVTIYPSLNLDFDKVHMSWLTVLPLTPTTSRVHSVQGAKNMPAPGSEQRLAFEREQLVGNRRINAEDRGIVEMVQRGVQTRAAKSGRLSHLELPIREFGQYLARQLAPVTHGREP